MRITLNLATRPFADLGPAIKRLRIAMGVLASGHRLAWAARHPPEGRGSPRPRPLARRPDCPHHQERQGYQDLMRQPDNAQLLKQVAALNKLFDEKAFSWTLAMEDLETVLPGGVQVTTLEPVDPRQKGRPHHLAPARARPARPRRDLVRNLEHSAALSAAPHRGRKRRGDRPARPAPGAGERIQPRGLRSAGRVQPRRAGTKRKAAEGGKSSCFRRISIAAQGPRSPVTLAIPWPPAHASALHRQAKAVRPQPETGLAALPSPITPTRSPKTPPGGPQ
jgi:hypothetical protein